MQAAVYEKYGPPEVVSVKQVEKPAPGEDEVLVKVYATTIRAGDVRMRSFNVPPGERMNTTILLKSLTITSALSSVSMKRSRSMVIHVVLSDDKTFS